MHSLILFLKFGKSQAHVSYKLVSYKKKVKSGERRWTLSLT